MENRDYSLITLFFKGPDLYNLYHVTKKHLQEIHVNMSPVYSTLSTDNTKVRSHRGGETDVHRGNKAVEFMSG